MKSPIPQNVQECMDSLGGCAVINTAHGVPFVVRPVMTGDRYGLGGCLIHDEADPLMEFFDARHAHNDLGPGQFVTRYRLSTIREHVEGGGGIDLCGSIDDWRMDAAELKAALTEVGAEAARRNASMLVKPEVRRLAGAIAEAVAKDEAPEAGGFDLSAGLFGANLSAAIANHVALASGREKALRETLAQALEQMGCLIGAIDALETQVNQMKGLFDDSDGCIQEALDDSDETCAAAYALEKAAKGLLDTLGSTKPRASSPGM